MYFKCGSGIEISVEANAHSVYVGHTTNRNNSRSRNSMFIFVCFGSLAERKINWMLFIKWSILGSHWTISANFTEYSVECMRNAYQNFLVDHSSLDGHFFVRLCEKFAYKALKWAYYTEWDGVFNIKMKEVIHRTVYRMK